jgi:hypothetical protein
VAEDRAASSSLFDKNVGEPALGAGHLRKVRFNAEGAQLRAMPFGMTVGTCRAHIAGPQSPFRRGYNGGSYLTPEANLSRYHVGFSVTRRKFRYAQHDVRGIFSKACEICEGSWHDAKAYLI